MKTHRRRPWSPTLGVESSFFPRARKALQDRLRAQGKPGEASEPRQKAMWEILAEETPAAGTPPPPAESPERMRPGFQPSYSRVDPGEAFGVPKMWAFIDQKRREPGYSPRSFVVDILTPPVTAGDDLQRQIGTIGEIAMFFGIPASAFEGLSVNQAWQQVIGPMFQEFEGMMNRGRPAYIPGFLSFDLNPQNQLEIVYYDR